MSPVQCIILDSYPLPESIDDGHDQLAKEIIFPLWAKVQLSNHPRLRDGDAALNQPTQSALQKASRLESCICDDQLDIIIGPPGPCPTTRCSDMSIKVQ